MGTREFFEEIDKHRVRFTDGGEESTRGFAKRLGISHNALRYWSENVGKVGPETIYRICERMKWPDSEYWRLVGIARGIAPDESEKLRRLDPLYERVAPASHIELERTDLQSQNEELTAQVAELKKRNAELERQIAYLEGKVSGKTSKQTVKRKDKQAT